MEFKELSHDFPRMDFNMSLGIEDIRALGLEKVLAESKDKSEFFRALYPAIQNMFESMAKINALGCVVQGKVDFLRLTGVVGKALTDTVLFEAIRTAVADIEDKTEGKD